LRDKVQIATKVGPAWKDGAVFRDSHPARIRREIEDSLRRLRTDVIDLAHGIIATWCGLPKAGVRLDEPAGVLGGRADLPDVGADRQVVTPERKPWAIGYLRTRPFDGSLR
jgi:hypothetical protein